MEFTRRSFLAGLGSVSVGFLFARKLDAVLKSLERELVAEQQAPDQQPSAAEIVVMPDRKFYPKRIVVPLSLASLFIIEDIRVGTAAQFARNASISAEAFSPKMSDDAAALALDAAAPGVEIRFRVRYIGSDPRGARFQASMIGTGAHGDPRQLVLPIDSGVAIVG
jgi:hypothetical protein